MTISDVLYDAAGTIRRDRCLIDDETFDDDDRAKIDEVLRAMDTLRIYLTISGNGPDPEWYLDKETAWRAAQEAALIPQDDEAAWAEWRKKTYGPTQQEEDELQVAVDDELMDSRGG